MGLNLTDPKERFYAFTFHYYPSMDLSIASTVVFGILTIVSLWQAMRYGGRFMFIVPAMGLVEVIGYGTRILTIQEPTVGAFIVSTLCILMAPIALALVNYIAAGELLSITGKTVRFLFWQLTPKQVSKIFFWGDVVCFFIQSGGGGMLANANSAKAGSNIVLIGLAVQMVFFFSFIWVLICITSLESYGLKDLPSLRLVFAGLWSTIFCLLVRNIFRFVEFASAPDGPAYTTEWVFYVFETLAIALNILLYCIFHFGKLMESKLPNPKWKTEYAEKAAAGGVIKPLPSYDDSAADSNNNPGDA